jgi:hypothetical protein
MIPVRAMRRRRWGLWIGLFPALAFPSNALADGNFVVTPDSNGFAGYDFAGMGLNPSISLIRGQTYTFQVNDASHIHPFAIVTTVGGSFSTPGVANNDISQGTVTYAVPIDAPPSLFYECGVHLNFGSIFTQAPPPVPALGPWGVALFALSLCGAGMAVARRRIRW